ncbi:hypothetical protein EJD97_017039 [Solanum chilense]|uniref:DUF4283 domain-containing protein n=1 Tax=Solanum chilense TaxID=4083 RepID=A0A6N2B3U7_SOLCI|nr:hypothetical protein EJD97_017039 [Solanum chilense]
MTASPSPQPMVLGEKNANPNTGRIYASSISENQRYSENLSNQPEVPDLQKILPPQLGFKGECNIGLLESRHVLLRFTLKEDYVAIFSKTSRSIKFVGTVIQFRIGYDYLPYYCKRCKHKGHREVDCRTLTDGQVDATVSENHIEGETFQGDFRVHLNAKKADSNRLEVREKDDEGTLKDLR